MVRNESVMCFSGLSNKVIIVTGATGGVGRAVCARLSAEGARIVAVDRDADEAQRLAGSLEGAAIGVGVDLSTPDGVDTYMAAAVDAFGRADGVHHNAGICEQKPLAEVTADDFDRTVNVNLRAVALGMAAAIRQMVSQQTGGSIVNTASTAGIEGTPNMSVYTASKFAIVGLSKTAALEYAREGIRVNVICPGVIDTKMAEDAVLSSPHFRPGAGFNGTIEEAKSVWARGLPIPRMGRPSEIAAQAAFLLSDECAYQTGAVITVDAGITAGSFVPPAW
jgi:NAD(P)-dependent dehydrogenase (short-subunit alcohol dehydrogenase family)